MSDSYFIEGHKSKTRLEDEETLVINRQGYASLEEATAKAKELFAQDQNLGLAVIYKRESDGSAAGVKFIYKDEEGTLEDLPLFWGSGERCGEGCV